MAHKRRIAGYEVLDRLGAGGFGTVYRVKKPGIPDRALKILNADLLVSEQAAKRFEREVNTLRSVAHEGCVKVFESGRLDDGSPFFVMELLEGEDLAKTMASTGRLSEQDILRILEPLCRTLQASHQLGIVHRDIKASNIFLCSDGRIVLLDFGIAKVLEVPGMTLTMSNQVVGTACAMSPEQLAGAPVSAQTDIYGLGALTFYMLTGGVAFDSDSLTMTQHLHGHAARIAPSFLAPVTGVVDEVVVRAMALRASDRQPSCEHFYRQLSAAFAGSDEEAAREVLSVVVHVFLGTCGSELREAQRAADARSEMFSVLGAVGFQRVAERMRGMCCALVLSDDATARARERARARQAIATARESLSRLAPVGSSLMVCDGEILVAGQEIRSGAALVPPL